MITPDLSGVYPCFAPPDTDPALDEPGLVEMLKFRAKNLPGPRVYPVGALTQKLEGGALTGIIAVDNLLEALAEQLDSIVRVIKAEQTKETALRK